MLNFTIKRGMWFKMTNNNPSKITQIFSTSDVEHGLSLFRDEEIRAVEGLIIERNGKFYIKCQIKDRYKIAKPEEILRQLWIYRLLNEYNYPKERIVDPFYQLEFFVGDRSPEQVKRAIESYTTFHSKTGGEKHYEKNKH